MIQKISSINLTKSFTCHKWLKSGEPNCCLAIEFENLVVRLIDDLVSSGRFNSVLINCFCSSVSFRFEVYKSGLILLPAHPC